MLELHRPLSPLEIEQACDIRRSVLCGELHLGREAARDADDDTAHLVLALEGEKPVATGRLVQRGGLHLLEHLAVLPRFRRLGAGRAMVAYFVTAAKEAGVRELVAVAPQSARAFFVAVEFVVEKEDGEVALLRRQL